jgi:hypothetical protein
MESCIRNKFGFDGVALYCQGNWTLIRPIVCIIIFAALAVTSLTSCATFGPATVARDRFKYTDAISESWKRQMLLNMVKLRYKDAPIFLDVSSIINQYALEGEIDIGLSWSDGLAGNSQGIGGRGRYADRPTITYQPLMGKKFARSLMTPIPPSAILSLNQSGYRTDSVFRLCVQSINGIYNRFGRFTSAIHADPEYYELMASLRTIQDSRGFGVRIKNPKSEEWEAALFFRTENVDPEVAEEIATVKDLLGLNSKLAEYQVVYGSFARDDTEIAIQTRSMLEILNELGSYIDVPEDHVTEKRVSPNPVDEKLYAQRLIRVYSAVEKPDNAYVAANYRSHWFWIDDRDLQSKGLFTFLMFLFSLAETGETERAPVLTLPAG